jgi:hypothetical protein
VRSNKNLFLSLSKDGETLKPLALPALRQAQDEIFICPNLALI